ncbi:MAG: pantetheine-phosphate adenylyltransferase [Oscillospiraceae bacterium]|nr:pantetheine-phosphate adenylyltransferase [Oscillospiraceae bacterium]
MKTAIYPGSFDPITLGHLNVIKRAARAFDRLIVCVMVNSRKSGSLFTPEERVELIRRVTSQLRNVEVDYSQSLLADYAREKGAHVVVKGLRAVSDYESEVQMAIINRKIYHNLDTFFIPSSEKYTYLSSTVVREMARYGADLSDFVPREIIADVNRKFQSERPPLESGGAQPPQAPEPEENSK